MTDHAQREALIAKAQSYSAEMASRADDAGRGGRIIAQLLAALRASAPPAPEGDRRREPEHSLAVGDVYTRVEVIGPSGRVLVARPTKAAASVQDGGRTLKVFLDREPVLWTPEDRATPHTARTAIGEPPTGMREVPGTPGLYETCADLDVLARETTERINLSVLVGDINASEGELITDIIRAALDRVKEGK